MAGFSERRTPLRNQVNPLAAKSQKETFWAKLRDFFFERKAPCESAGFG
jgi:hypothetical protein